MPEITEPRDKTGPSTDRPRSGHLVCRKHRVFSTVRQPFSTDTWSAQSCHNDGAYSSFATYTWVSQSCDNDGRLAQACSSSVARKADTTQDGSPRKRRDRCTQTSSATQPDWLSEKSSRPHCSGKQDENRLQDFETTHKKKLRENIPGVFVDRRIHKYLPSCRAECAPNP